MIWELNIGSIIVELVNIHNYVCMHTSFVLVPKTTTLEVIAVVFYIKTFLWPILYSTSSQVLLLLLFAPNVKGEWVDSNFHIIDLLVQPRAAGVAGTLIFVHIANFATLQPWLHVGSFTCRILIHCIRTRDPYFYVPLRDTELLLLYIFIHSKHGMSTISKATQRIYILWCHSNKQTNYW